jgi:acetyl-CoA carboxylase carboxyltransferase component
VLIATRHSTMGMAGPPLVEAALGVKLTPEEIGPADVHHASGVIDILVEDEAEAIEKAKRYLAFFEPALPPGEAPKPHYCERWCPTIRDVPTTCVRLSRVSQTLAACRNCAPAMDGRW